MQNNRHLNIYDTDESKILNITFCIYSQNFTQSMDTLGSCLVALSFGENYVKCKRFVFGSIMVANYMTTPMQQTTVFLIF